MATAIKGNSEVTKECVIYLAGLFDGEGSVVAHHFFDKRIRKNGNVHYGEKFQFTIEVRMAEEKVVMWIQKHFGGNVCTRKPGERSVWRRHQYHWRAYNDDAVRILKMIYPYLIVKKRQAALAFKFRETIKQGAWSRDSHRVERLRELVRKIQSLNNFGEPVVLRTVETVRKAELDKPVMIQSELHGDMQKSQATAAD